MMALNGLSQIANITLASFGLKGHKESNFYKHLKIESFSVISEGNIETITGLCTCHNRGLHFSSRLHILVEWQNVVLVLLRQQFFISTKVPIDHFDDEGIAKVS